MTRLAMSLAALSVSCVARAAAQDQAAAAAPAPPAPAAAVGVELNKLETTEKSCRAYLVITNSTATAYQALKLDLVLFQTDGIIGKRFALDLAPMRADKKAIKAFEIDGMTCDKIGSFLINDVTDCKTDAGPADNCLQRLQMSSKTNVQISK